MTDEQNIVYTNGILLQAYIECQAMIADNELSKQCGVTIKYDENDFKLLIEKYGVHHNALITNLTGR